MKLFNLGTLKGHALTLKLRRQPHSNISSSQGSKNSVLLWGTLRTLGQTTIWSSVIQCDVADAFYFLFLKWSNSVRPRPSAVTQIHCDWLFLEQLRSERWVMPELPSLIGLMRRSHDAAENHCFTTVYAPQWCSDLCLCVCSITSVFYRWATWSKNVITLISAIYCKNDNGNVFHYKSLIRKLVMSIYFFTDITILLPILYRS